MSRASLLESGTDKPKFMLTCSMSSDSADLKRAYEHLVNTYTADVKDSTVVLFTKFDNPNENLGKKLSYAKQNCDDLGLPYMMFKTDHGSYKLS
jgi:hypothetical protein